MKLELFRIEPWIKRHWRGTAVTVIIILVLGICGILGDKRLEGEVKASIVQKELAAIEELEKASIAMPAQESLEQKVTLDNQQEELLRQLWYKLEENNLVEAAAILNQNQTQFNDLFYDIMGGEPFRYDGNRVTGRLDGFGIVFKRAATVFYGNFVNGKPEGDVLALQVLELNAPRYDYAVGKWMNGKMNGFGTIGYHYYEGIEGEESKEVEKQGMFQDDMMNSEITYTSINSEEISTTWHFKVSEGGLNTDERWKYDEELKTYSLLSDSDEHHAYVVKEEDLDKKLWKNIISWIEE